MTQNSNTVNVPESREALNNMKYEVAQEMGVNLKKGYNGDLTAKENGTVGGNMVKKMIENYERKAAGKQ
ncbi:MAG: alpha/beta-type small acid-soluble spore protein [Clostridia bacterium]|nr:alpha/beta-type small acid-soluble spore protein [Clostridia bacterium]